MICESGEASVGFVGVTGGAMQSTLADVHKPVENTVPAFTCTNDSKEITTYDRADYLAVASGEAYGYLVNVTAEGLYDIVVEYRSSEACVLEICQNGEPIGEVSLAASDGALARIAGRGMALAAGRSTVTLRVKEGSAALLGFYFHKAEAVTETTYDFEDSMRYSYRDGSWKLVDGSLVLNSDFGKYMVGSENWSNYVVESDITVTSGSVNAGLCVRVSNPATHEVDGLSSGSDYLQGYFIGLGNGSVVLGKHNFDWQELGRVSFDAKSGQTYRLTVEVIENEIRISVDGELLMTYVDTDAPFLHGMVGYRAHSCTMRASQLTVSPIDGD